MESSDLVRLLKSKLKLLQLKIDDRDLDINVRRRIIDEEAERIVKLKDEIVSLKKRCAQLQFNLDWKKV